MTPEQRERIEAQANNDCHRDGEIGNYGRAVAALLTAHDALQAQLAEAQKVHQSISETLIRESELTNSWMQRALEAERERDEERADYKRIVGELSDMAGQLEAACQERDAVRAENMALAARVEALLTTIDVERTAKDEARAEVERLGSTLTGATQHSQDVTRQWMDERVRAIAAERGATHWQAEHGRLRARIADTAYAITFQTLGQYRSALLASSTPAPTGDRKPLKLDVSREWCIAAAEAEAGHDVSAGSAPTGDGPQTGGEGQSRSVQRRQATQRGEPIPTFSGDGLAPETPASGDADGRE